MGKTYRTGLPDWDFRKTLLRGDLCNKSFEGRPISDRDADRPSRASLRRRRESRKVPERSFHTKLEVPARVHRRCYHN